MKPRQTIQLSLSLLAGLLLSTASSLSSSAQALADQKSTAANEPLVDRTYQLKAPPVGREYIGDYNSMNEILTALRNMLDPVDKIFLVPSRATIFVRASEGDQSLVAKMLATLDQPRPRYRLTYTLTELDGGHKVGVQHFSMVVLAGQRSEMKQGSRLPISAGGGQFTYLDVGINFDTTLIESQGGGVLRQKVEDTSIAPDSTAALGSNPLLRQTQLEGTTALTIGKPQLIGSLDVPSSTHHFDIEVVMEPVN